MSGDTTLPCVKRYNRDVLYKKEVIKCRTLLLHCGKGRLPFLHQDQQGADCKAQAVATDTGIVSQAGSFSRKPPAVWSQAEIKALVIVMGNTLH